MLRNAGVLFNSVNSIINDIVRGKFFQISKQSRRNSDEKIEKKNNSFEMIVFTIFIFRKKGVNIRSSVKREHPLSDFHHATSETETSEQSMKITSCTHFNGHHSIRQSCPKTRTYHPMKE